MVGEVSQHQGNETERGDLPIVSFLCGTGGQGGAETHL